MLRFLTGLFVLLVFVSGAQADYIDAVNKGNEALLSGDYKSALENYHVAETDIPESPELSYNMGLALYGQQAYEEATERFTQALETEEADLGAAAYYNLGNVRFQAQDYVGAIENFKRSLEMNPEDMDAKYNLELSRKMLKENSETEEKEQQEQKPEGEEEKDDDGDKSKKDDEGDKQQKDEDGKQQGEPSDEEQEKQDSQQLKPDENKPMSKEDAERILNALKDDEREVQKKIKRVMTNSDYSGKDW